MWIALMEDMRWLGFEWSKELYASDYFEQLYQLAVQLIKKGLAYVDDSSSEEIAAQKGYLLNLVSRKSVQKPGH